MSETAGATEAGAAAGESAAGQEQQGAPGGFDSSGLFNEAGQFGEIGAKYANEEAGVSAEFIDRYFSGKTPGEVAQSLYENKRAASQKAVAYPGGDASDDDRAAWNSAAGVPDSVEQVLPENMEEFTKATGWTNDTAVPVIQAMIDAGAPGPVIQAATAAVHKAATGQIEAWNAEAAEAHKAAEESFRQKYGEETGAKLEAAQEAAGKLAEKAGIDPAAIEDIKQGIGDFRRPELTQMFAHLAETIREAQFKGPGAPPQADQFQQPRDLAHTIMNDANHFLHEKYLAGDPHVNGAIDDMLSPDETKQRAAVQRAMSYR